MQATHLGYRPRTGHRHRGKYGNHYDGTSGETHACTIQPDGNGLSVCGVTVYRDAENAYGDPVTALRPIDGEPTCQRCRLAMGLTVKPPRKRPAVHLGS